MADSGSVRSLGANKTMKFSAKSGTFICIEDRSVIFIEKESLRCTCSPFKNGRFCLHLHAVWNSRESFVHILDWEKVQFALLKLQQERAPSKFSFTGFMVQFHSYFNVAHIKD